MCCAYGSDPNLDQCSNLWLIGVIKNHWLARMLKSFLFKLFKSFFTTAILFAISRFLRSLGLQLWPHQMHSSVLSYQLHLSVNTIKNCNKTVTAI